MLVLRTRLALFLFGTPNIVGCLCALGVLVLFFAGIIRNWWLPLTAGAWLFGWLITPRPATIVLERLPDMRLDEAMTTIMREYGPRLPADATKRLGDIQGIIHDLAERSEDSPLPVNAALELGNTIKRDLPTTLANYVALPPSFARIHPVQGNKTARELLQEQLDLFHTELTEIANSVYAQDTDKLISQGEYLKQKFRPLDFLS